MKMTKSLATLFLPLLLLLLVGAFQNCTKASFDGNDSLFKSKASSGNGDSYPGKPGYYLSQDPSNPCNRLSKTGRPFPKREIFVVGSVYSLVRDNCQDISPVTIDPSAIQIDPTDSTLIYQGEKFNLELDMRDFENVSVSCPAGKTLSLPQTNLFRDPLDLVAPSWGSHPTVSVNLAASLEALPLFRIQANNPATLEAWRRVSQSPFLAGDTTYVATFVLARGNVDHASFYYYEQKTLTGFHVDIDLVNRTTSTVWQVGVAYEATLQSYGNGIAVQVTFTTSSTVSGSDGDIGVAPYRANNGELLNLGDSLLATAASLYQCQ